MNRSSIREAFFDATESTSLLLRDSAVADGWERPSAVEGFTVGGLAGHVYAVVRLLEVALDDPLPASPQRVGLLDFYGANRISTAEDLASGLHPLIREDAERRARYGAQANGERFAEMTSRLKHRLADEPLDRLVPIVQVSDGVTSLEDYLATRVVELAVHHDDITASLGLPPPDLPESVTSTAINVLVDLARARSGDVEVIRAFSRRERARHDVLPVL